MIQRTCKLTATCGLILLSLFAASQLHAAQITKVIIETDGKAKVNESFVRAQITGKANDELDPLQITGDVKSLLDTGRFTDVLAEVEEDGDGVALIFIVRAKLRLVERIRVIGTDHLGVDEVEDLLELSTGDLVDETILAVKGQAVIDAYNEDGYRQADLKWDTKEVDAEEGTVTATLTIDEGSRTRIDSVEFDGNTVFSTKSLRYASRLASRWNPLRWFGLGSYSQEDLGDVPSLVRATYLAEGYLEAHVGDAEWIKGEDGKYTVKYKVTEGQPYGVTDFTIKGTTIFPGAELRRAVGLRKGAPASLLSIAAATERLRTYYTSRGYRRTSVSHNITPSGEQVSGDVPGINVLFNVSEGSLMHVRNVFIQGNKVTQEKVLRRELSIYPGDVYDERQIRRSENRLRNLGYFKRVNYRADPTPALDESDIVFEVEEQRTGSFMVGGGFSSVDNLVGFIEITERNFNLGSWPPKGAGQKLKLRGQFGSTTSESELSFVEPWLFGRKLAFGVDLYRREKDYSDYDVDRTGVGFSLGKSVIMPFFNRIDLKYELEDSDISDVSDTNEYFTLDEPPESYYFEYTNQLSSRLSLVLTRDTRNSYIFPSAGNKVTMKAYVSGGALGGDNEMYGWRIKAEQYFPALKEHVIALKSRVEVVDSYGDANLAVYDRLYLGGGRTIRGFDYRGVGPKVKRDVSILDVDGAETGESVTVYRMKGGRSLAMISAEYVVPLVDKINLAAFIDSGNVWEDAYEFDTDELATAAGFEIRFNMPQFPVKINYAWTISKDDEHTEEDSWGFWIGSGF